ncbi:MAG: hypothetical protein ACTHU0_22640 [Kofleriaceae bacterium]
MWRDEEELAFPTKVERSAPALEQPTEPVAPAAELDPSLGGGAPDDVLDAFGHYVDDPLDQKLGVEPTLLADATRPKQAAPTRAPSPSPAPDPAPAPTPKTPWRDVDAPDARKNLELEWMDKLPPHVRDSVDVEFANEGREEKRVAQRVARDPALKKLDKERDAELEKLRKELAKNKVARPKDHPSYQQAAATWRAKRAQKEAELAAIERQKATRTTPNQSAVDKPTTKGVAIDAGKTAARKNFREWNRSVFRGDLNAAKRHYQSIEEVDQGKDMWLAKSAADRYRLARTKFEADHKGFTLPTTTVAQTMRGLHQDRKGIGMLGHALGLSIDLRAYGSPNIQGRKGSEPFRTTAYMLEKFGGDLTTGKRGRAQMNLARDNVSGDARIKRLGQHTVANQVDAKDEQTAKDVREQFLEMSETSRRFQNALPEASMDALRAARELYYQQKQDEARIAELRKDIKSAGPQDKLQELERLERSVNEAETSVAEAMKEAFKPWTTTLKTENRDDRISQSFEQDNGKLIADERKALKAVPDADLEAFAADHELTSRADFRPTKNARTYKDALSAELSTRAEASRTNLKNATGGIEIREALLAKLGDPSRVFGDILKKPDGTFGTKDTVRDPSVMQLLERGFVHDDGQQTATPGAKKELLNVDTVETLARFGFAPGATFLDTHHYDFVEGYDVVPGGRSWENMNEDTYSPEGPKLAKPAPRGDAKKKP